MNFVDFHSHMLFGTDDGAATPDESLRMIAASAAQGATDIVLSPHFYPRREDPETFLRRRNKRFEKLSASLPEGSPRLHLGAEIEYFEGLVGMEQLPQLRIGEGKCILVEMPFVRWTDRHLSDICELNRMKKYRVVLAHIERYLGCVSDGDLSELVRDGVIIQSNAEFFLGFFSKRRAAGLLMNGIIHLIGSDAHNMKKRPPNIAPALEFICDKCDPDAVTRMAEYSKALLKGGNR